MNKLRLPLEVLSYGFSAMASGDGEIYLETPNGEVEVGLETDALGNVNIETFQFISDDGESFSYYYLEYHEVKAVSAYIEEHKLFAQYMDKVVEVLNRF